MPDYIVPVRELAEFCYRSGDIDYRFTPSPTAVQGIAGHQRVYQRRGAGYQSEYAVEQVFHYAEFSLLLRGRADGYDQEQQLVEEIKTCRVDPELIPEPVSTLHWAQARLYAALICQQQDCSGHIDVQVTWFNVDSGQESSQRKSCQCADLQVFLQQTLEQYAAWMQVIHTASLARDLSITELPFPHPEYRPGQREIAETVYKCIAQAGQLLLQAPTGIGKTAAVLYPAVKAIAGHKHQAIAYVTAKTVGSRAAEQALQELEEQGLRLHSLTITAKERVCFSPGNACHGDDCDYARGYYDRLPAARLAAFTEHTRLSRDVVEKLARRFEVCPYQLAADLLGWVDACVCDIHYVYSLTASIGAILETRGRRWSVLLDEAHNLPDRARSMYSAELCKQDLMAARKECAPGRLRKALDGCNRALLEVQKLEWLEPEFHALAEPPPQLLQVLQVFAGAVAEQQALEASLLQTRPRLRDFYFCVLQFLRVLEELAADYQVALHRVSGNKQSLRLQLRCLHAGRLLQQRQKKAHSVTAFSATVSPPGWVLPALGFEENAVYLPVASPFSPQQLRIRVNTKIDTRFRMRPHSLPALAQLISNWLEEVEGNCIVYFPAYQYLADTLELLLPALPDRHVLTQQRSWGDEARKLLLETLQQRRDVAAFCILGGVFGEGIDLPGEELGSVVVVGVGLPQFNRETQALREYYQAAVGQGFEYAYLYPGMQKVNQALGRVIRGSSDRGSALLIDGRYREPAYRNLLPSWWQYDFS